MRSFERLSISVHRLYKKVPQFAQIKMEDLNIDERLRRRKKADHNNSIVDLSVQPFDPALRRERIRGQK